ncbi:zeta toxin family protein [Halalkalibacter okhensis]|uniref:UDP-N-acetylglucosamine kinase n=1 Tax=Halalkalibacter okhensis TaxID=333138 RepID=A0A0B0ILU1_9BACI|nr:zeta toxin family protein [Halalkalibacter okhensis]KHF40636.1 hypothetical protein LQ50_07445 [Halalkalibacter okhensis]
MIRTYIYLKNLWKKALRHDYVRSNNGNWKTNFHSDLIKRYTKKAQTAKKGQRPIAILIGGGTASGKSSLRKSVTPALIKSKNIQTIAIDPDDIKEQLPHYHKLKKHKPNHAAALVHKESRKICQKVLSELINQRKHLIYEETMARTNKYMELVKSLKAANYEIYVYIVDVPLKTAKKRADQRAKLTGRHVPHSIIERTHKLVPRTFELIKEYCDEYRIYDTTKELRLIASNDFLDEKKYALFLAKGRKNRNDSPSIRIQYRRGS